MTKNYNVSIEDNGATYLIVINKGSDQRLVVGYESSLGKAWERIKWLYEIESQEFTVGVKNIPVKEWLEGMKKAGYLD